MAHNAWMDKFDSSMDDMAKVMIELSANVAKLVHEKAIGSSNLEQMVVAHNNQGQMVQVKHAKIDFLRFDGTDPLNWIFKAEQFFNYYEMLDSQQVILAAINMEGDVMPWF